MKSTLLKQFTHLQQKLEGDLYLDDASRLLYATDASVYKEKPIAVIRPKNSEDIKKIVAFAQQNKISIIPRAAGTSLAGQVVGAGMIVDVSKYMNRIIEIHPQEKWVRVEPGVILDELNMALKPYNLFFGPETSTANRCMMGGMVGNNACGSHSLIYGSTRDHTLAIKAILSDGSEVEFSKLTTEEFHHKTIGENLENKLYRNILNILSNPVNQKNIRKEFPDPGIHRRNTGYAIDVLLQSEIFSQNGDSFNFSKLLAGSEGTLAITTEIKLNLVPTPPAFVAVVCVHFYTLEDALLANLITLKYSPGAVELMDHTILELTKGNIEQLKNRFFIKDDPGSILIIEFARETKDEIQSVVSKMQDEMQKHGLGYYFPVIFGDETKKVWNLRKAGLGVLSNVAGDAKPVSVIEDTAVRPEDLLNYISDFKQNLNKYGLECVYHAHIGTGELHLRPVLNLKEPRDVELFYQIAYDTAVLVKKYNGSLSGEHGDGRLRGEFIPLMIGRENYELLKQIKNVWDPFQIFNPGKITDTLQMNSKLRYIPGQQSKEICTYFDFSDERGFLRAIEKCNGSADCRKTELTGGLMCPSYMATRDEMNTTRGRANILREMISNSNKSNPFDHKEIFQVMDLCLSCKGCKSECPSSIDIAKLKAEFMQQYYKSHFVPIRTWMIASISKINALGSIQPLFSNFLLSSRLLSDLIKKSLGFASNRSLPLLSKITLKKWASQNSISLKSKEPLKGKVFFFADEFTNYNDSIIGIKTIKLLTQLGYQVEIPKHVESGRTYISKGFLKKAKKIANKNIELLSPYISEQTPLIGIEPSAILSFRDEYLSLTDKKIKIEAIKMAPHCLMIDEFICREIEKGKIIPNLFLRTEQEVKLHGHCHQKSLASIDPTVKMLKLIPGLKVEVIPSGCCGMAGSFGYEKEHYEVSMRIGELILFPEVRKTSLKTIIAAPGMSCRHQIQDGTNRFVKHPIEILFEFLRKD